MKTFATLAAAAGMAALVAAPALAQDMEMTQEEEYYTYRASVVAYERCTGAGFDQEELSAIEGRITQLIGGFLSPGLRLSTLLDAEDDMNTKVTAAGCGSGDVEDAVALFESDIAPALGS